MGKSRTARSPVACLLVIGAVGIVLQLSVLAAYRAGAGLDGGEGSKSLGGGRDQQPQRLQEDGGGAEQLAGGGQAGSFDIAVLEEAGLPTSVGEARPPRESTEEEGEEAGDGGARDEPEEGNVPGPINLAPFVRDAGSVVVPSRQSLTGADKALVLVGRYLRTSRDYRYPTDQLVLTQANHKKLRPRDSVKRVNLLPASHPNLTFSSCALVGNAGGLLAAKHGPEIDRHEAVMRVNQGPIKGYEFHVGSKVNFRLINKKWASVYASKLEGQALLLPKEKSNTTFIVTRASKWAFERLAAVVRRERPDVRVLYLANGPVSRARWMLKAFRTASTQLGGNYTRGDAPSSGMIGMYLLLQMCHRVTVYGLGQALPDVTTSQAFAESVRWAPQHERPPCLSSTMNSKAARASGYHDLSRVPTLLPRHPYPYHYFFNYPDSWQLRAHPHHDFDCETDLMHVMSLGSGPGGDEGFCFCPPPPPGGCSIDGSGAAVCRSGEGHWGGRGADRRERAEGGET